MEFLIREKVDVGFFGKEESDPASVVYDGIEKAKEESELRRQRHIKDIRENEQ